MHGARVPVEEGLQLAGHHAEAVTHAGAPSARCHQFPICRQPPWRHVRSAALAATHRVPVPNRKPSACAAADGARASAAGAAARELARMRAWSVTERLRASGSSAAVMMGTSCLGGACILASTCGRGAAQRQGKREARACRDPEMGTSVPHGQPQRMRASAGSVSGTW
jgi:hypothetical protein